MDAVRNFLAAGLYLKQLRLDAPAFRDDLQMAPTGPRRRPWTVCARLLPEPLDGPLGPLGGRDRALGSDPVAALGTLLKYAGAPLRWEPLNIAKLHRATPSPRALFPCELELNCGGAAWKYLADYHALAPAKANAGNSDAATITIDIIANAERIAPLYGEFSPFLLALEAGHVAALAACLGQSMGFNCSVRDDLPRDEGGVDEDGDWMRARLCRLQIAWPYAALDPALFPPAPLVVATADGANGDIERFSSLRAVMETAFSAGVDRFQARAGLGRRPAPQAPAPDIRDAVKARSSGQDGWGYVPRGDLFNEDILNGVLALWARLNRQACFDETPDMGLRLYVSVLNVRGADPSFYGFNLDEVVLDPLPEVALADLFTRLVGLGYGYNFREFSLVVTMTCDFGRRFDEMGPVAFKLAHLQAGRLAQLFCLSASAHGMFARPIRSYSEPGIEAGLGVRGQAIYQILCGFDRINTITFELG